MKRMSVIAVALALASTATAEVEDRPALFDKLDVDKDGQISIYEAEAYSRLLEQFSQLDQNADGLLSREEFAAFERAKH